MSKERFQRLTISNKKNLLPTSQGNRRIDTRSPGMLAAANKFWRRTNPAAQAISGNKAKYNDYKE